MSRCLLLAVLLGASPAFAHAPSTAFVAILPELGGTRVEFKLDLRDAARAVHLDQDRDGKVTWGELKRAGAALEAYVEANLKLKSEAGACELKAKDLAVDKLASGTYAVVTFASPCDAPSLLTYDGFFAFDADHRAIVRAGGAPAGVLTTDRREVPLTFEPRRTVDVVSEFAVQGVFHIWEGFDHMLFLVTLLIPAVFRRSRRETVPFDTFGKAFWQTMKIVTAFTVAHSVTLLLVALGYFSLPTRVVEAAIAFSIIVTALNNIWPLVGDRSWAIAGGFGLLHGCSYASILSGVGLAPNALLTSVLSFNLGVEIGQAALVVVLLPLCYAARNEAAYRRFVLLGGSAAAAGVAAVWMAERVLDFKVLPF